MTLFVCALLEFLASEILQLAGRFVSNCRHFRVSPSDVRVAMHSNIPLMEMFFSSSSLTTRSNFNFNSSERGEEETSSSRNSFFSSHSFLASSSSSSSSNAREENFALKSALTYQEIVKNLLHEERQFQRELQVREKTSLPSLLSRFTSSFSRAFSATNC
jgi:son of sevenless-like protein